MSHPIIESLKDEFNIYPECLGFYYFKEEHDLKDYEYVFVHSDFGFPINKKVKQLLTGAETAYPNTYSWCALDFSHLEQMPNSKNYEVPTVGFVGRVPILKNKEGVEQLHKGFEPRYSALAYLDKSTKICLDAHIRFEPLGDSCGFWNNTIPNKEKWEPLFETNMLANTYALSARGNGNYAQRFYEALAYGRIPIYIDSGGRIPWDHIIKYKNLDCFVWVKEDEIKDIESKVLEFHETHNIKKCQDECRSIYEGFLTFEKQVELFKDYFEKFKFYEV